MTSAGPQPPVVPPSDDPDADARFAAYLADVAANVDDPEWGEEHRAILDDDPETQRALFDLAEAMAAGTATTSPLSTLVTAVAVVVLAAVVMVFLIGVLI
ncbi:hypothetical protein GCM10009557_01250 [Virgisporangium ochraceum]|uniref:Uncharacterized protein n=1 Tax=Virgisporangium ochraceum TaxID=65505 RepID=A0A8J4EGX4_9ACTN|nr:hypothetical protein [Virgisporangium ochraceum]GIJ74156.1 hypothetical protein Voc01_090730 [Virgisporangium ochraceum]